ncbi:MAG: hypothetical protein ACK2UO_19850 [Caldilineaceae bacterium]
MPRRLDLQIGQRRRLATSLNFLWDVGVMQAAKWAPGLDRENLPNYIDISMRRRL